MPRIHETILYKFDELSTETKEKAISSFQEDDSYLDYDWHEWTINDFKTILELIGYYDITCYFSGFHSQGDGACFSARFSRNKRCLDKVKKYCQKEEKILDIVEQIQSEIPLHEEYEIKHSGHYYHEYCTSVYYLGDNEKAEQLDERFLELSRQLMVILYKNLNDEYDYLNSSEAIIEHIKANDYEFTEDGKLY